MAKRKLAEIGDNNIGTDPEREDLYTAKWIELERKRIDLATKQKDLLHEAKNNHGILKGAVKKAAKTLLDGAAKHRAKQEVSRAAEAIVERFSADPDGQFYLFNQEEQQEEAA